MLTSIGVDIWPEMIRSSFNCSPGNSNRKRSAHNARKFVETRKTDTWSSVDYSIQESVTFDPFTSLSVPVPKRISIDTIVVHRSIEKAPRKVRLSPSWWGGTSSPLFFLSFSIVFSWQQMDWSKTSNGCSPWNAVYQLLRWLSSFCASPSMICERFRCSPIEFDLTPPSNTSKTTIQLRRTVTPGTVSIVFSCKWWYARESVEDWLVF